MTPSTEPKKGIVLRKTRSGNQAVSIHRDTLIAYLQGLQTTENGWIEHIAIPREAPKPDAPNYKLVLDTPQYREVKTYSPAETKA